MPSKVYEKLAKSVFNKLSDHDLNKKDVKSIIEHIQEKLEGFFKKLNIRLDDLSEKERNILIKKLGPFLNCPLPIENNNSMVDVIKWRFNCAIDALFPLAGGSLSERVFLEGGTFTLFPDGRIRNLQKIYIDLELDIP